MILARRLLVWLSVVWAGGAVVGAQAADAIRVMPLVDDRMVAAGFVAGGVDETDTIELVRSGLLVTMTYVVELKQASVWWDRTVGAATVSASVKFDNLTSTYHVSHIAEGHVSWSRVTKDLAEARAWLGTFDRIMLANALDLEPNTEYYIHVRQSISPRQTFVWWPFGRDERVGRAEFTHIR